MRFFARADVEADARRCWFPCQLQSSRPSWLRGWVDSPAHCRWTVWETVTREAWRCQDLRSTLDRCEPLTRDVFRQVSCDNCPSIRAYTRLESQVEDTWTAASSGHVSISRNCHGAKGARLRGSAVKAKSRLPGALDRDTPGQGRHLGERGEVTHVPRNIRCRCLLPNSNTFLRDA